MTAMSDVASGMIVEQPIAISRSSLIRIEIVSYS